MRAVAADKRREAAAAQAAAQLAAARAETAGASPDGSEAAPPHVRYAAYVQRAAPLAVRLAELRPLLRLRGALRSLRPVRSAAKVAQRSADIGDAVAPLVSGRVVAAATLVTWTYIFGDVAWDVRRLMLAQPDLPTQDVARHGVQRFTFQLLSSYVLPSAIIHTIVHDSHRVFNRVGRFQRFGPAMCGLAVIPLLPYVLDEAVEKGVEYSMDWVWPAHRSEHAQATGQQQHPKEA